MQISLKGEYKSLSDFTSDQLSDFTIITGENGSGKSQLVELLTSKKDGKNDPNYSFSVTPELKEIQIEGLEAGHFSSIGNQTWANTIDHQYSEYRRYNPKLLDLCLWLIEKGFDLKNLSDQSFNREFSKEEQDKIITTLISVLHIAKTQNQFSNFERLLKRVKSNHQIPGKSTLDIVKCVIDYRNKDINSLTQADFFKTHYPFELIGSPRLFSPKLEFAFLHYLRTRYLNSLSFFEKERYGYKNESISDLEFDKQNPSPWDIINNILSNHKLNFKFSGIERQDFSFETNEVDFKFLKTTNNKPVYFNNLSSGEKLIIGLILKLFASEAYSQKTNFPDLIVLDEPDAHLHPEMSKLLIDVLNETFVKKLCIKVIMTTHSPSTIALAPEDSIYQLQNHPETSLRKIKKNAALKMLTGFIPTLSIDYENHKQVFVESPTDVSYYQTVFDQLNIEKKYPFRLYFVSNAKGKGNCNLVYDIVDSLRNSGNKTSFGIVDWDLKNTSSEFIMVHGQNERYSLENFIYDPLYFAIYFISNKGANNVLRELELNDTFNEYSIINETNDFLQKIVNWFFGRLNSKHHSQKTESVNVKYYNDKMISIPKWYIEYKGHDLTQIIKMSFPSLQNKDEEQLIKELTVIMAKSYPLIPLKSVEIIEEIIKGN